MLETTRDPLFGTSYRFVACLGRGGMGEVVEAEHRVLGKRVVVKLLHAELSDNAQLADRMRIEGQVLARLAHPNLVAVDDFGRTPAGRTYIVMERLRGRTLRDELRARGPLPVLDAIDLVRQCLAGLAAAHAVGVVHRDVKLENLFVCDAQSGRPRTLKVLDFGVAKLLDGSDDHVPRLAEPTELGVIVGSLRFLAPEQARTTAVDARTDVYAAGAVLYTLLAGRAPFQHVRGSAALLEAHATARPVPPSFVRREPLPPSVERAVLCALEKRPEDRFQSAAAFREELEAIAEEIRRLYLRVPTPAPVAPIVEAPDPAAVTRPRWKPAPLLAAATAVTAAGALGLAALVSLALRHLLG